MNCPVCPGVSLTMTERSGVEIDYCPKCRGVWLDRGELDKLIDRASADDPPAGGRGTGPAMDPGMGMHGGYNRHTHRTDAPPPGYDPRADSKAGYPYKRKSMWREMFDF